MKLFFITILTINAYLLFSWGKLDPGFWKYYLKNNFNNFKFLKCAVVTRSHKYSKAQNLGLVKIICLWRSNKSIKIYQKKPKFIFLYIIIFLTDCLFSHGRKGVFSHKERIYFKRGFNSSVKLDLLLFIRLNLQRF